jgi:putative oxidoreductase
MSLLRRAARLMLGWVFVHSGIDVLRNPHPRAEVAGPTIDRISQAAPFLSNDRVTLVRANAAVQLTAGTMLAIGRAPRLAALTLAASLVPTTIGGHSYWTIEDPARRMQNRIHFNKNLAILGGLVLAAVDTGGRPSPSWRARRAARRRSAAGRQISR